MLDWSSINRWLDPHSVHVLHNRLTEKLSLCNTFLSETHNTTCQLKFNDWTAAEIQVILGNGQAAVKRTRGRFKQELILEYHDLSNFMFLLFPPSTDSLWRTLNQNKLEEKRRWIWTDFSFHYLFYLKKYVLYYKNSTSNSASSRPSALSYYPHTSRECQPNAHCLSASWTVAF